MEPINAREEARLRVQERILDFYVNRITAELKAKSKLMALNEPIDFEDLEDDMREVIRDLALELEVFRQIPVSCNS